MSRSSAGPADIFIAAGSVEVVVEEVVSPKPKAPKPEKAKAEPAKAPKAPKAPKPKAAKVPKAPKAPKAPKEVESKEAETGSTEEAGVTEALVSEEVAPSISEETPEVQDLEAHEDGF